MQNNAINLTAGVVAGLVIGAAVTMSLGRGEHKMKRVSKKTGHAIGSIGTILNEVAAVVR